MTTPPSPHRVLLLGATGTIGRATARALLEAGHALTCLIRPASDTPATRARLPGAQIVTGDPTDPASLNAALQAAPFDALICCLASRTGHPADAWAIDHAATVQAIEAAKAHSVPHFILLSAICVQKPLLAFQHAKLAAEEALIASGLTYSIIRPTAFFKSLSGQLDRLKAGKPFLLFGDGTLTACKPISDADLGRFLTTCLTDPTKQNAILPIGGPGPALTPLDQGKTLFELLGKEPKFKHVPVALMSTIIAALSTLGRVAKPMADKAEFARIGRYYATESMLVLDPATGRYDADATPEYGTDTLPDFYARALADPSLVERGDHAVF